jgi:hypothetical protein
MALEWRSGDAAPAEVELDAPGNVFGAGLPTAWFGAGLPPQPIASSALIAPSHSCRPESPPGVAGHGRRFGRRDGGDRIGLGTVAGDDPAKYLDDGSEGKD